MSPTAAKRSERSSDDGFGTRGGSRSDGRVSGWPTTTRDLTTAGTGTDDGAGHEAGFVTSNPLTSLPGRLDGRRPEVRIRSRRRVEHG